jgi:3-mercaptopyruvate sulfurtransferase SseA
LASGTAVAVDIREPEDSFAALTLKNRGYQDAPVLKGGLKVWEDTGLPT